jgi:hypothetical protein
MYITGLRVEGLLFRELYILLSRLGAVSDQLKAIFFDDTETPQQQIMNSSRLLGWLIQKR